MPEEAEQLFETVATKRGVFMGVSAMISASRVPPNQFVQLCRANATLPGCDVAMQNLLAWERAYLAVHLSTFAVE